MIQELGLKSVIASVGLAIVAAVSMGSPSFAAPASAQGAATQGAAVALAPHRAVYDLKLGSSRGRRGMQAVRGRILYDFSGSPCEGYALQFRQVSELDSGEGRTAVSDLRATTWEEGGGQRLRFHSQNFLNDRLREAVDGQAERSDGGIAVRLTKPKDKNFDLRSALVFPTEHVRQILAAARAGKTLLEKTVYDGSESGEKLYETLTVIGRAIPPDEKKPADAAADQPALAGLSRWPVTISYFDKTPEKGGEQTPVYAITFELYENGVSRALVLDYGDFVVNGEMTSIEIKNAKPCP
jgi:hypothetical protein